MTVFETPSVTQVDRRPLLGYLTYLVAATLFALNGTVSKYLLLGGVPWMRLSQLRVTLAFGLLVLIVAITHRRGFRLRRSEIRTLLIYGIFGIAATQSLYFLAIQRLPVGIALLFEFTAPIMVALWFRFVLREPDTLDFSAAFGEGGPVVPAWGFVTYMVVLGTVVPFALVLQSLRHLRATQASAVGMTEPVIASAIAFVVLGELLTPVQVLGGAVVLAGVLLAETSR